MNHNLKDEIVRWYLDIKMNLRYIFNRKKHGNDLKIPFHYICVFHDDFTDGYSDNWDNGAQWDLPPYHPGSPTQWYDPDQIIKNQDGIAMHSVVKPKYFPEIDTTIPNAMGILRTKESWKYGIFRFKAKLPSGKWLWPALWLSGRYSWPPEIDVLEAFSDDTYDYSKGKILTSNVHYGRNGDHIQFGCYKHRLPNKVTEEFIDYDLWWEKDFIKIYYNGYLVSYVTDKKILNDMFEAQRIIIGNGIDTPFNQNNLTPIIVQSVTVYQKPI